MREEVHGEGLLEQEEVCPPSVPNQQEGEAWQEERGAEVEESFL